MNTLPNTNNPLVKNNVCIIIRGTSGSGKSTFAEFLEFMIDSCEIITCCADDYHMVDGEYNFDYKNLGKAHKYCQEKAESAMRDNVRIVVIANTSTSKSEVNIYKNIADKHGYEVSEIIMGNDYQNVHNVPEEVLKNQKKKLLDSIK
jgi:predicted kinase